MQSSCWKRLFSLNLTDGSLESCENAPIFCEDFHERLGAGGDKLVENFSKRSETDFKLCIWLGCGLLWPQLVKDMGKFSPIYGNHLLLQYIMAGYEAPLRVGYNKVTRRVNAHTEEVIISGEVVLTTLMPIVIIIIFIFICTQLYSCYSERGKICLAIILVINAFIKREYLAASAVLLNSRFIISPILRYPQL